MAKRKKREDEVTVSALSPVVIAGLESIAEEFGASTSAAAKIAIRFGVLHLAREGVIPDPGKPGVAPGISGLHTGFAPPRPYAHDPGSHRVLGGLTPCGYAESPYGVPRSLLLEGGGDGEPPPGGESGARPGGLAAEEIPETGTESGERSSAEPTVFDKAADLVQIAGRLLPADRQFVADCMSKLRTRKRSPLSGRDCGRLNALWEAHSARDAMAPDALRASLLAEEASARRPLRPDPPEASTEPRSGPTDEQLAANRAAVLERLRHPTRFNATETQLAPGDGAEEDAMERNRQALEELRREVAEGDAGGES